MAGKKEKMDKEHMVQIDNNDQDSRLQPNHINNYIKWKRTKLTYWKIEMVMLDKKSKAQVVLFIRFIL